jgi:hypothetical protein
MRPAQARRPNGSLTLTSGPARGTAAAESTFTLLLLLSAGMAAVPVAADPVERVRDFYLRHTRWSSSPSWSHCWRPLPSLCSHGCLPRRPDPRPTGVACGAQDKPSRSGPLVQCSSSMAPRRGPRRVQLADPPPHRGRRLDPRRAVRHDRGFQCEREQGRSTPMASQPCHCRHRSGRGAGGPAWPRHGDSGAHRAFGVPRSRGCTQRGEPVRPPGLMPASAEAAGYCGRTAHP